MPKVLVAGATIQCNHGGTARLLQGDKRLEISKKAAITAGQETDISFAPESPNVVVPCTHMTQDTPPKPSPCTGTLAATAPGISVLLAVGGSGVLLDSASGKTTNADPADQLNLKWAVVDAGQTLLSVDH